MADLRTADLFMPLDVRGNTELLSAVARYI
jgi:hypothetical protein